MSDIVFTPNKLSYKPKQSKLCVTIDDKVCLSINRRDEFGIVRFIGCLTGKGSDSYYYGVELTSGHGKNDGKHNKIEYFRCGIKKGIFVKRARIHCVEYPNIKSPRISIGDTVKIKGKYNCEGTVKYIGIPTFKRILQKGNWFGIQLNKKIGSTNGTINGIKYFYAKKDYGILITAKHINVIDMERSENEEKKHGISVRHIDSGSLGTFVKKSKKRSKHKKTNSAVSSRSNSSKSSKNSAKDKNIEIKEEEEEKYECEEYDKIWIITNYGYPISFLLSDKKGNISILKQQIINTFGHIETLENEQIFLKNVDKMCLLVWITFHRLQSQQKAIKWKFCWKNKTISIKKREFKQWKQQIDVKQIFPIHFLYRKDFNLQEADIKMFLIKYLTNLEDLSQYEWQIKFIDNVEHNIQCIINFSNNQAREKLFNSKFIELNGNKNNRCKLTVDIESIKK